MAIVVANNKNARERGAKAGFFIIGFYYIIIASAFLIAGQPRIEKW